jgi:hypothetical protein
MSQMTVNKMIECLQQAAESGYGDCEVRLAFQPHWPLQFTVAGITTPDDEADSREPDEDGDDELQQAVYIVEGRCPSASPYAPKWVFEAARTC